MRGLQPGRQGGRLMRAQDWEPAGSSRSRSPRAPSSAVGQMQVHPAAPLTQHEILHLQRTVGNACVAHLLEAQRRQPDSCEHGIEHGRSVQRVVPMKLKVLSSMENLEKDPGMHDQVFSERERMQSLSSPKQPRHPVGFDQETQEYHFDQETEVRRDDRYGAVPAYTQHSGALIGQDGQQASRVPGNAALQSGNFQHVTGRNSHSLTGAPESGNHPLRADDGGLTTASYMNAQNLMHDFGGKNRPGMGSALLIGDHVIPHSSMKWKSGDPNLHGVVRQVMDNAPENLRSRPQHGKCAEVGAISDYLHNNDRRNTWTVEEAKRHFERVGAATTAHRPGKKSGEPAGKPADACPSCQYLTGKLGISWYTREVWEAV
ncbi:hypothetical protein GCM10027271_43290 [Saccharopolyspora gloriosae]|uniref:YwqJ-like deaminase n=1 Tax=Saccharopolyspora gloriosae TaxID=455344 RepID=A0A840NJN7_9PSEU|nr:YwqJ-related putative deaminase [Saccharopolyspora gloriosae]MBB5070373.1 hypothetical protein [Saccharopolyspora gloriosae]